MTHMTFALKLSAGVAFVAVLAITAGFGNAVAAESGGQAKVASPAPSAPGKPTVQVAPTTKPVPAAPSKSAPISETKVYKTDKLLNAWIAPNSDFVWWENGAPTHWTAFGGVRHEAKGFDDKHPHSVRLLRGSGIKFALPNNKEMIGSQFRATIEGKASKPNMLAIVLEAKVKGEKRGFAAYHPGDGKWHSFELRRDITDQFDPGSLVVKVCRAPGVEGDAVVDYFRCRLVKGDDPAQKAAPSDKSQGTKSEKSTAKKDVKKSNGKK